MPTLHIPDLPEEIHQALARKAASTGRSLSEQAIIELQSLVKPDTRKRRLEVIDRIRREVEKEGLRTLSRSPADLIREDRER